MKFIYFKDFRDLDFFYIYFFFHFLLRETYTVPWAANHFVCSETPKNNAFKQVLKFKFHFEHFLGNTRFPSFDGPTNYLYLFKNHQQTFSWPGERPASHLKVTKLWFGPNMKTFRNYSLRIFAAGRYLLLLLNSRRYFTGFKTQNVFK